MDEGRERRCNVWRMVWKSRPRTTSLRLGFRAAESKGKSARMVCREPAQRE